MYDEGSMCVMLCWIRRGGEEELTLHKSLQHIPQPQRTINIIKACEMSTIGICCEGKETSQVALPQKKKHTGTSTSISLNTIHNSR